MSICNSWQSRTNCPALWCLTHFQVTASPLARDSPNLDHNCIITRTQQFFNTFENKISIFSFYQEIIFSKHQFGKNIWKLIICIKLWINSIKIALKFIKIWIDNFSFTSGSLSYQFHQTVCWSLRPKLSKVKWNVH